ncbi:MAG TPA: DbpA RNA binding domain-containing protein, partial [Myxococcaceae bacterium]
GPPERALLTLAPLFERYDPAAVAAALYDLWTAAGTTVPTPVPDIPATARVFVGVGKKDGATVNDLVAILTKEVRVERGKIGRVELRDAFALVEIPAQEAERVASALNGMTIRRKRVTARVDRGGARPVRPVRGAKRT